MSNIYIGTQVFIVFRVGQVIQLIVSSYKVKVALNYIKTVIFNIDSINYFVLF